MSISTEYAGTDGAERADHVRQFRPLARGRDQRIGGARQRRDIAAGAIFQHELEAAGGTQSQNRRQAEGEREGLRHLREARAAPRQNGVELRVLGRALVPRLQRRR